MCNQNNHLKLASVERSADNEHGMFALLQENPYLLHLGLQCYDRRFLAEYCRMPATPLMVCV